MLPGLFLLFLLLLLSCRRARGAKEDKEAEVDVEPTTFVCTEVVGVSVTQDWFRAGFKKLVGAQSGSWQLRAKEHAFVNQWADVHSPLWSMAVESPCASHATKPDRVLFTAVDWEMTTTKQWATALLAAVKAVKERHQSVKRIELLTMLRGPKNKPCGDEKTAVDPVIDEAIQAVADAHQGLVVAGPKFEAPSCDVFSKGGPHFTDKGKEMVGSLMAKHYAHP